MTITSCSSVTGSRISSNCDELAQKAILFSASGDTNTELIKEIAVPINGSAKQGNLYTLSQNGEIQTSMISSPMNKKVFTDPLVLKTDSKIVCRYEQMWKRSDKPERLFGNFQIVGKEYGNLLGNTFYERLIITETSDSWSVAPEGNSYNPRNAEIKKSSY